MTDRTIGCTDRLPDESMRDTRTPKLQPQRIAIAQHNHTGVWIKVLEYDDLEGGNTENSIEKLSLCYQYWE